MQDPKQRYGEKKDPLMLVPTVAVRHLSRVLLLGKEKYGAFNWRETGVCSSTYLAAALRHLFQHLEGEDTDAESGESHLAHVMANCAILLDAKASGTLHDDRPPLVCLDNSAKL